MSWDWVVRPDLRYYVASLTASVLLWYWVHLVFLAIPRSGKLVLVHCLGALCCSTAITIILVGNSILFIELGDFLSPDMLVLIEKGASFITEYLHAYLLREYIIYTLPCFLLFAWLWWPHRRVRRIRLAHLYALLFTIPVIDAMLIVALQHNGRQSVAIDIASISALRDCLGVPAENRSLSYLRTSQRIRVEQVPPVQVPTNVLLIINESWEAIEYKLFESLRTRMPFLEHWQDSEPHTFMHFPYAFANSNATVISVPSILTGVAPHQSNAMLHTMPLLWDWARASNFATCLVSSHRFSWGGMTRFFSTPGPDVYVTAESINAPLVNDMGVDDLESVEYLCRFISNLPAKRQFCAVYNTNALHAPGQQKSDRIDYLPERNSRYERALLIVDGGYPLDSG